MTTNEVEAKLAQNRKNAFIQARLAVKCCEANTDKNKCIGCSICVKACPFGAMQDLVAFKPQKLGLRLNTVLGIIPYLYLGLAVLYAAVRAPQ